MNNRKSRWTREEMAVNLDNAFRAAAFEAYKTALQTGTPLVLWQDGKVVEIDPHSISFEDLHRTPGM